MLRDQIDECTHFRFTKKLLASFAVLLALVLSTSAQATTVTNSGNATNICDEDPETCCISFTITFSEATDHVRIQLVNAGSSDACIDLDCWLDQDNYPFVQHTRTANGVYDIHFSPAKTANQTYTFTMCAPASCWANWSAIRWEALLDDNTIDYAFEPLHPCWYGSDGCSGCDKTELYQDGNNIVVCFTKMGSAGAACSLKVSISPKLELCNDENGGIGPTDYVITAPLGFTATSQISYPSPINKTEIIFVANGPTQCLPRCNTICFKLKGCPPPNDRPHSVKVFNMDDSSASCDPPPQRSFKRSSGATWKGFNEDQIQNYPNPVTALSGFTTLIPYTVEQAGEAVLVIADETGKVVYTQSMNPDGKGTFGFNVDAGALSAGRYFYKVESPRGKMILAKTMMVVK